MPDHDALRHQETSAATAASAENADAGLQQRCDEYLAGWKRAQADYANLLKETERSRQEFAKYAADRTLLTLLPAIDQFEVAMSHVPAFDAAPETARKSLAQWLTGLEAVCMLWESSAKELGLEKITAEGEFDPARHEAVAEEPHSTVPVNGIIRVMQNGWKLNGKLIRPAKVIISKGLASTEVAATDQP